LATFLDFPEIMHFNLKARNSNQSNKSGLLNEISCAITIQCSRFHCKLVTMSQSGCMNSTCHDIEHLSNDRQLLLS